MLRISLGMKEIQSVKVAEANRKEKLNSGQGKHFIGYEAGPFPTGCDKLEPVRLPIAAIISLTGNKVQETIPLDASY